MELFKRSAFVLSKQITRHCSSTALTKQSFVNGVQTITLSHAKTRNSLSIAMLQTILDNIKQHENDENLRAIVLAADGTIFSAGHNLKELAADCGREQHEKVFKLSSILMKTIIDCPVPVIAKVDGLAAAAGCQLVAQCDMAVCTEKSSFSTPGANFGIFCSTPGIALARCVPKMTAMHMLLTGNTLSSHDAVSKGLVTKVTGDAAQLDAEVEAICAAIMTKSRAIIELGKRFYYKQVQYDVKKAYDLGKDQMVENIQLKDGQEGIRSFTEKRKPQWNHRN